MYIYAKIHDSNAVCKINPYLDDATNYYLQNFHTYLHMDFLLIANKLCDDIVFRYYGHMRKYRQNILSPCISYSFSNMQTSYQNQYHSLYSVTYSTQHTLSLNTLNTILKESRNELAALNAFNFLLCQSLF